MNEQTDMSEHAGATPPEPVDAAKAAMLEAVEQFRDTVATPRPVERIAAQAEAGESETVDLNSATKEELERLPGVGPILASRIVEHRATVRRFSEPQDIVAVPGIGQISYERLAPRLVAGPAEAGVDVAPVRESESEGLAEEAEAGVATTVMLDGTATQAEGEGEPPLPEAIEAPVSEFEGVPVLYRAAAIAPEQDSAPDIAWPDDTDVLEPPPEELELEEEPLVEPALEAAWRAEAYAPELAVGTPDRGEPRAEEPVPEAPRPEQAEAPAPAARAEERPPAPEPPIVEVVAPSGGCWRHVVVGVLSALAGAALALLALILLNRTLDFRTQTNQAIQAEAARFDGQMDRLGSDVAGIQTGLDSLSGLAGRVEALDAELQGIREHLSTLQGEISRLGEELGGTQAAVESLTGQTHELGAHVGALEESMQNLATQVGEMASHVGVLSEQVEVMRRATDRFDAFLEGLRVLLHDVEGPGEPTPWPTALRPIPETPTPITVTVIPLATPTP